MLTQLLRVRVVFACFCSCAFACAAARTLQQLSACLGTADEVAQALSDPPVEGKITICLDGGTKCAALPLDAHLRRSHTLSRAAQTPQRSRFSSKQFALHCLPMIYETNASFCRQGESHACKYWLTLVVIGSSTSGSCHSAPTGHKQAITVHLNCETSVFVENHSVCAAILCRRTGICSKTYWL